MGIGVTNVVKDDRGIIRAKLQSHNSVGLKAMRFRIQVVPVSAGAANAVFTQEKGMGKKVLLM
jgi:hypothetical protein